MPSCYLSSRSVKATRKRHHCDWCGQTIEKGKPAEYSFNIFENEPSGGYMHPECNRAYSHESQTTDDFDFGWSGGKFERGGFKECDEHCCDTTMPLVDDALAVLQQMYNAPQLDTPALGLYAFTKSYAFISELYGICRIKDIWPPTFTPNFAGDLIIKWMANSKYGYICVYFFSDFQEPDFIYISSKLFDRTNLRVTPRTLSKYLNWGYKKRC